MCSTLFRVMAERKRYMHVKCLFTSLSETTEDVCDRDVSETTRGRNDQSPSQMGVYLQERVTGRFDTNSSSETAKKF